MRWKVERDNQMKSFPLLALHVAMKCSGCSRWKQLVGRQEEEADFDWWFLGYGTGNKTGDAARLVSVGNPSDSPASGRDCLQEWQHECRRIVFLDHGEEKLFEIEMAKEDLLLLETRKSEELAAMSNEDAAVGPWQKISFCVVGSTIRKIMPFARRRNEKSFADSLTFDRAAYVDSTLFW